RTPSQQPLDRQDRQQPNAQPLHRIRPGLPTMDPHSFITSFDPRHTAVFGQLEFVCLQGDAVLESVSHLPGKSPALDDDAELGIQIDRARVKIERADEDALTIDGEGLGVQTGAGAAEWADDTQVQITLALR